MTCDGRCGRGAGDSKLQGRSIYTELYVPPKAANVGVQLLAESAGVAAAIEVHEMGSAYLQA